MKTQSETRHIFTDPNGQCVACLYVMRHTLSDVMQDSHPIRVHKDGSVSEPRDIFAPELPTIDDGDDMLDHAARDHGWELLRGWTGQYGYNGPVMHPSEYVGGKLARHILETPGYYVAVAVDDSPDDPGHGGWVVAYREPMSEAETFFYDHGGYYYDTDTESREQGRRRSARESARAERDAEHAGIVFRWDIDEEYVYDGDAPVSDEVEWWSCQAIDDETGDVLAALHGIGLEPGERNYVRVVEAELASEALDTLARVPIQCLAVTWLPDTQQWRVLSRRTERGGTWVGHTGEEGELDTLLGIARDVVTGG